MKGAIFTRSYRKALKLAVQCDADLLAKALLTPPLRGTEGYDSSSSSTPSAAATNPSHSSSCMLVPPVRLPQAPPIPLSTSIADLVRSSFRGATPPPPTADGSDAALKESAKQKKAPASKAKDKKDGAKRGGKSKKASAVVTDTAAIDVSAIAAAFFGIRWMQQSVSLGRQLRRAGASQQQQQQQEPTSSGSTTSPACAHAAAPLMPLRMAPTESLVLDYGHCSSASLAPCSVLYGHPSCFEEGLYRAVFVAAGPEGWGPQDSSASAAQQQGAGEQRGEKKTAAKKKSSKKKKAAAGSPLLSPSETFPIIQMNCRSEGTAKDLFDSMPQLLMGAGGAWSSPNNISTPQPSAQSLVGAAAAAKGALAVLGRLPVFIGGPHATSEGPYLVHSNHTIAYLLAARRGGARVAATAAARPFYVERLADVAALPARVVAVLSEHNCRVVVNHFSDKASMGRGVFLHDVAGRSAPIALFGAAAAMLTPAAAAAIAAGRAPYPALPKGHNDWASGLAACGLGALGAAAVLTPQQRASVRSGRRDVWESSASAAVAAGASDGSSAADILSEVGVVAPAPPVDKAAARAQFQVPRAVRPTRVGPSARSRAPQPPQRARRGAEKRTKKSATA